MEILEFHVNVLEAKGLKLLKPIWSFNMRQNIPLI